MDYWEFLIQKEGDRTWQTLQSSDVSLEEGRYRLVVRTTRKDTEVDLRIVYESARENPPRRRMQKRSRRTNLEGLMVIVPYTYLKAGVWEFRCRPDFLEDLMGDSWQHRVCLQVLPKPAAPTPELPDGDSAVSLAELGEIAEFSEITDRSATVEAPENPKSEPSNPWEPVFSSKVEYAVPQALLLTLKQDTYLADRGKPIPLSGRVELPKTAENQVADAQTVLAGELRISLRDPQNGQILGERRQTFAPQQIPFSFAFDIQIPPNTQTRLFLGEISLYGATEKQAELPLLLASKSFTITADLNDLLSAIADNFTETEVLELPSGKSKSAVLDLTAIETKESSKTLEFKTFQPSSGAVLPPLLYQPSPFNKTPKPLDLPTFGRQLSAPVPTSDLTATELEVESSEENLPSITSEDKITEVVAETSDLETEIEQGTAEQKENLPVSPTDSAFKSLKLEDRFLSRLNAFATDAELSEELRIEEILEEEPTLSATELKTDPMSYEIVVDDEPLESLPLKPTRSLKRQPDDRQKVVPPAPSLPHSDEPVPAPKLEVPEGEIIAGQPFRIRIEMPIREPRLAVKLWVVDLQSRSTIEMPRWVGDFFPDPWGNLEATTQITVPFGCLEIRIEAMATELLTKRESHKTSVDRTVIPPDLPTYSADF